MGGYALFNRARDFCESLSTSNCSCHEKSSKTHEKVDNTPLLTLKTNLTLSEKLFMKASVVTMEKKYAVTTKVAEFWCTITSVFFAMPLFVMTEFDFFTLSPLLRTFIVLSVITAAMSFVYHWTLMKLYSSADCAFATMMIALGTAALCIKNPSFYPIEDQPIIWVTLLIITGLIFVVFWESTAMTSLVLFALFIPVNLFCLFQLGYWDTLLTGTIGIACFLADRKGIAPTHSLWHFFGGLHLYYLCLTLITN